MLRKEMESMNKQTVLQKAITVYGKAAQSDMMIEEMSELTKALLKLRRLPERERGSLAHRMLLLDIREEMADVQIMLDQMRLIYGNAEDEETKKLHRLGERLGVHG